MDAIGWKPSIVRWRPLVCGYCIGKETTRLVSIFLFLNCFKKLVTLSLCRRTMVVVPELERELAQEAKINKLLCRAGDLYTMRKKVYELLDKDATEPPVRICIVFVVLRFSLV
jgi:hypothetical protein